MSQFRRIFPPSESLLFDGGLNTKFERSIIEDNESPDCKNVVFSNGAVETRQGATKLNSTAVSAVTTTGFDGLYTRRASDNSETMCAFGGGHMYVLSGTTFVTVPSAQSVFTAGFRVGGAQYLNYLFVGNGGVTPYKWNGAEFTRHGVYPPTQTATVASNGVGNLTGGADYRYKVTYVNSALVESDVGPVSQTFTISATSGQNTVSNIPLAPTSFGVNARYLYRNASGGVTFRRVTTINDNTTTSYNDNVADASLGANAPTDNGLPPNYSAIIYLQNRVFMNDPSNPNFVWYSELGAPYTVQQAANFIKVGDKAGDVFQAFGAYDNALVVKCEKTITVVFMPSSDPATWRPIVTNSPYGSKSPYCVVPYLNKLLFAAVQGYKFVGFAALSGTALDPSASIQPVSTAGSDLKSERIEPDMFQVQESYLKNMSGIVYKNKAYLSLTYGSGNTTNNRIYVMDFSMSNLRKNQRESWVPWTGINAAQFTIYNGSLYAASSSDGFVRKLESGVYNDDGAAIDSYFWTKELSGTKSEYNIFKDFRYANVLVGLTGAYYMNVSYRVDSDNSDGTAALISLDPGGALWGTLKWGENWGGSSLQKEFRIYLGTSRGKRIQFKFSNQNVANQRFKVHRMNFAYNVKGYR